MPGGTFRENLLRQPGQHTLRSDHYGSKFKFEGDDVVLTKESKKTNGKRKAVSDDKITNGKRTC